jgi:hypothetical protein
MKRCRECGVEKDLSEFYIHSEMADGHLNKCKECVKQRVRKFWEKGGGRESDKKRNQKPERKAWQRAQSVKMRIKHRAKRRVMAAWWTWFKKNKGVKDNCEVCRTKENVEAHHPDYNKPYEVMWLCSLHHKEWHRNNKVIPPNAPNELLPPCKKGKDGRFIPSGYLETPPENII